MHFVQAFAQYLKIGTIVDIPFLIKVWLDKIVLRGGALLYGELSKFVNIFSPRNVLQSL